MGKFSAGLQAASKVQDHKKGLPRKIALRRQVVETMRAGKAAVNVMDCFAGSGVMRRKAWFDSDNYVGCDTTWKPWYDHKAYCADNRRVLRAIDLGQFSVFDLDAYGAPWEQAMIIAKCRRRLKPGELLGLALTDGSSMGARMGNLDWKLAALAGVSRSLQGATREWTAITAKALGSLAEMMGGQVVEHWQAEGDGRAIVYSAAVLKGDVA